MAGKFFANLNSFPVTLPNQRGGQKTINPNEIVEGDWWSKLCGNRQLKEIDPEDFNIVGRKITRGADIRHNKPSRIPVRESRVLGENSRSQTVSSRRISKVHTLADDVCQSGCEASCEQSCELDIQGIEEFDHMRGVDGLFFCKYCDYDSAVQSDTEKHVEREHQDVLNPIDEGTSEVRGDVVDPQDESESFGKDMGFVGSDNYIEIDPPVINEDDDIVIPVDAKSEDVFDNERFINTEEKVEDKVEKTSEKIGVKEKTEDYIEYENGMFECLECGKRYKSKSWIAKHINSSHR